MEGKGNKINSWAQTSLACIMSFTIITRTTILRTTIIRTTINTEL